MSIKDHFLIPWLLCTFQWKPQGTRTGPVWRLRARMVEHANQAYLNACAGWDTLGTTVNVRFISMHSNCRRSFIFKMRKKLKVCSVIDHRSRQNVLKTKKNWQNEAQPSLSPMFSLLVLVSSAINNHTDSRRYGIYFFFDR